MFEISHFFQKFHKYVPSKIKSKKGSSSQPMKLSFCKIIVIIVYRMKGQFHQVHVIAEFTTSHKIIVFFCSGVWLKV